MTANWANQTIWTGDNLPIMRGMNSASVDLIYLDPPFNSKANYAAPIGSKAAGAEFKDTWTLSDVDAEWVNLIESKHPALHRVLLAAMTDSDKSYLAYMAVRLLEMKRVLKDTGSIYLHCDPTMSHYLKLVMDAIFGRKSLRNEIYWYYYNKLHDRRKPLFPRATDSLLFYTTGEARHTFNTLEEKRDKPVKQLKRVKRDGKAVNVRDGEGKLVYNIRTHRHIDNVWRIPALQPASPERLDYPTQKPVKLLSRLILASSNEDDMVLDPFCGCATACIAAQAEKRQWVGIDVSPKAAELVRYRFHKEMNLFFDGTVRTDIPQRTDLGPLRRANHPDNKKHLYGEQEGHCAGCNTHFEARNLEVDHIIARGKGGTDHLANLQLLCGSCNRIKGDRGMEYLHVKLQL